ncbi:MAG: acylphosphatase [Burkholderiales bacterium]
MQLRTIEILVAGHVQGVGFREAMIREAERLGLTGWVRNRARGDVQAVAQGSEAALGALEAWARRGSPAARVDRVDCSPAAAEHVRAYARFERWPTA